MSKFKNMLVVLMGMVIAPIAANASPEVLTDNASNACRAVNPSEALRFRVGGGGFENVSATPTIAVCSVTNIYDAFVDGSLTDYTDVNIIMTVNSLPEAMNCNFYVRDPGANNAVLASFAFTIDADDPGDHFVGAVTDIESFSSDIWQLNSYAQCTMPGRAGPGGVSRSRIYNISTFNFSSPTPPPT